MEKDKVRIKRSNATFEKFGGDISADKSEANAASGASGSAYMPRAQLSLPEIGRIKHSEAKKLMPPGGQLWQDSNPGGWHSRMPFPEGDSQEVEYTWPG